ncbi:MAG: PEGA domain-containing protein [Phycisphaerae bacterium]|nr:PEGA domain-containing protein [Phycisphaerae bacterium]
MKLSIYRQALAALALGAAALGFAGCVERSITVVTSPQHAVVYLNDVEVGRSPCQVPFEWYGDYSVRLRAKKNLGTTANPHWVYYYLQTHRTAHAPWFQWIGPDLFASLIPVRFKDDKIWAFIVPPVGQQTSAELIKNARHLKAQMPAPIAAPSNTGPAK